MFTKLREPFGKAGLIVAVVALVFAMLGGAYAATNNGGGKATASAKAKQGKQGKPGKTGPAGPAGPAGAPGAKGDAGSPGAPGASGKSVVTGTLTAGQGGCTEGGVSVEVEGSGTTKPVCNGKKGTNGLPGAPGQPWTTGGTLPASTAEGCPCTETGTWVALIPPAGRSTRLSLSFPIPLAAPLTYGEGQPGEPENQVHYINEAGLEVQNFGGTGVAASAACPGSAGQPEAEPGNLCVYTGIGLGLKSANEGITDSFSHLGAGTAGAALEFSGAAGEVALGTWAVTGK